MQTCKTCRHWKCPTEFNAEALCRPIDPDTFEPMAREFEVRQCTQPTQTRFEAPVERNGFALTDASQFYAALVTAEDFGCVRWEA